MPGGRATSPWPEGRPADGRPSPASSHGGDHETKPTRRRRATGPAAPRSSLETTVERGVERADLERVAAGDGDSGEIETLPDGSVSIPLFEEQLVVEKRLVVRERVIVSKRTLVEDQVVEAELRRERIGVDPDPSVAGRVKSGGA